MLKKTINAAMLNNRFNLIKQLSIPAFDNPGGPDEGNTGDEFSEDLLPENMKESFAKYKQTLIDKGVNIGVAREKEKGEKLKGKEIESFLQEQGLTREDIDTLKPYVAKHKSFSKLFEAYGTEDIDEIVNLIEEAEREGMTEAEKLQADYKNLEQQNLDFKSQISSLQKSLADAKTSTSEKEQKLLSFIEKTVVSSAIKNAAIELGAFDPDDVLSRVKDQVRLVVDGDDYIPVVVDENGTKRFDSNGDPVTINSLVSGFLEARPHLRKSNLSSGTGSKGGNGKSTTVGKFTSEQLKNPKFFQAHYKEIMAEINNGTLKL